MKHLRSRHRSITVTVADVAHTIELAPVGDGWFVGMAEDAVVRKCVGISPGEYQDLGDVTHDEPPPTHDEPSPRDTEESDVTLPVADTPLSDEEESEDAAHDEPTRRRGRRR